MSKRDQDLEYKVMQIIKECGEDGILQSHLWKRIAASSREGSRVALRLEKVGLIERRKELYKGKWTYKLVTRKKAVSIHTIASFPCFFCLEQEKCCVGGDISPINCQLLSCCVLGRPIPPGLTPIPIPAR